jgi:hypothetical protein
MERGKRTKGTWEHGRGGKEWVKRLQNVVDWKRVDEREGTE